MVVPDVLTAGLGVLVLYAAVLWLAGGVLGLLAGLRGWTAAAAGPLLTWGLAGLAGPVYAKLGVGWSPASFATGTVVVWAATGAVRLVLRRVRPAPTAGPTLPRWSPAAQVGTSLVVAAAAVFGVVVVVGGMGGLGVVPQDWDAVFHAAGIRWIADTGDGSLTGMARTNWYEAGAAPVYYPNAYHLLGALVYRLSGASVPAVLDAASAVSPGVLALGVAAMVRRWGGRPILAAASALAAVAVTPFYDLLWHGPVLPFVAGIAVLPAAAVGVVDLLDAPGARGRLGPAVVLAVELAGLMCLHPSILFSAVVFVAPALVQRWWDAPRRLLPELGVLAAAGVLAALLCSREIAGALSTGGNYEKLDRPPVLDLPAAIERYLTFGNGDGAVSVQLRLAVIMVIGLLGLRTLGALRWTAVAGLLFGVLYVLTAYSTNPVVRIVASIWWNDSWRFAGLAAAPLAVVIGQAVAMLQQALAAAADRAGFGRLRVGRTGWGRVGGLLTAAAALAAFVLATRVLYLDRNQQHMAKDTGDGPALSRLEISGLQAVALIVPPGQRVLNDRGDGSAWIYPLFGVRPVAAHYDGQRLGPAAQLLAQSFNTYVDNPAVRAAAAQLDVHFVVVDKGFLRPSFTRQPGLTKLDKQPWLRVAYRNPDVTLYEITPGLAPLTVARVLQSHHDLETSSSAHRTSWPRPTGSLRPRG